jgi:hypothetical protein
VIIFEPTLTTFEANFNFLRHHPPGVVAKIGLSLKSNYQWQI